MLTALILLAAMDAAPTPAAAQTTTPVVAAGTGQTRTLADVARERKLGVKPKASGTLSVAGAPVPRPAPGVSDKAAVDADARLARAMRDGAWVDQNIHYNEDIREQARREWDAAAENCRATPGCTPVYRENVQSGGVKPLRSGDEVGRDLKKKYGASVDVPAPAK